MFSIIRDSFLLFVIVGLTYRPLSKLLSRSWSLMLYWRQGSLLVILTVKFLDLIANRAYILGDYPTTLEFSQSGVPTATDKTIDIILPILASPIVQTIVGGSGLGQVVIDISNRLLFIMGQQARHRQYHQPWTECFQWETAESSLVPILTSFFFYSDRP